MNNQSFSKIWIIVILFVLLASGILVWQYFKVQEKEISRAQIAGKYILEELDSQGNLLERGPGIMTFKEEGSIIGTYSGEWEINEDRIIEFFEGERRVGSGKLSGDAITDWWVYDPSSWWAEKIIKKEGAKMIKPGLEGIVVWSDYFSPENSSFSLKLKENDAFLMEGLLEEKWKIENGALQIYTIDFDDGRIEGNNIVFKFGDGFLRLIKQK